MPRAPIVPLKVGNNGAWKAVRSSSAQGSCGVHGYPCMHPGVDVAGRAGTPVAAPENGVVAHATDGRSAPFVGYGPWLVIIKGSSGKFHLLAHLEPTTSSLSYVGQVVKEGQVVGKVSSANHTHWEVRDAMWPPPGKTNFDNNSDPIAWMRGTTLLVVAGLAACAYAAYELFFKKKR